MSTVYGIIVNWYDPQPMLQREYVLRFFPEENHIEMYDTKSRRTFLRKSPAPPSVNANELYIGNEIMVHSRALKIVGYLDPRSKEFLSASQSTSVAFISPDAFRSGQFGSVLTGLTKQGFTVKQLRLLELNEAESEELASLLYGSSALPQHVSLWSAGRCVAVCLGAQDAVSKLAGAARLVAKAHGGNGVEGVVHCTEDGSSAAALADFAFGSRPFARSPTARYGDCACCVIRPHAVKAGHVGGIVQMIEEAGFEISAAQLFKLDVPAAAEFLEVYDGVVPDYDGMVRELASSECVALELRGPQNCAAAFRDFAGPWDVDFAKELRPKTIRAKFGVDRVQNAVHCTVSTRVPRPGGVAEMHAWANHATKQRALPASRAEPRECATRATRDRRLGTRRRRGDGVPVLLRRAPRIAAPTRRAWSPAVLKSIILSVPQPAEAPLRRPAGPVPRGCL